MAHVVLQAVSSGSDTFINIPKGVVSAPNYLEDVIELANGNKYLRNGVTCASTLWTLQSVCKCERLSGLNHLAYLAVHLQAVLQGAYQQLAHGLGGHRQAGDALAWASRSLPREASSTAERPSTFCVRCFRKGHCIQMWGQGLCCTTRIFTSAKARCAFFLLLLIHVISLRKHFCPFAFFQID